MTGAAAHDGARLPEILDKNNTASQVWADTAYRSKANETRMQKIGFVSKVHFRRSKGVALTALQAGLFSSLIFDVGFEIEPSRYRGGSGEVV